MRSILYLSLLAASAYGLNDAPPVAPQTEKMEPRVGKSGTIIRIWGKSLDKAHVDEVYLTDHRFDMKVKILEQTTTQLTVRVPPFVKPGRLQLLLLTAGNKPVYLEQPWFLLVEAGEEDPAPAPVEISRKYKPTVEVAATGTNAPVPLSVAAPSPALTASVEKSVVPLKAEPLAVKAAEPPPPPPPPVKAAVVERVEEKTLEPPARPQAPVEVPNKQPAEVATFRPEPAPAVIPQNAAVGASIPAQIVRRSRVAYPPAAVTQRIEGTVELIAIVRADGHVKDVKVLKGNPVLAGAALASVREWLYEPAYMMGKPVESEVPVILNFKRP